MTYQSRKNCGIVESWEPKQPKPCRRTTLPELLRLRETHGLFQQRKYRGHGYRSATNPNHVASKEYLSYRGAWNPTRMQNAILIVGPGTPASSVKTGRKKSESAGQSEGGDGGSNSSQSSPSDTEESEVGNLNIESNEDDRMEGADEMEEEDDDMDDGDDDDDDDDDSAEGFRRYMRFGSDDDEDSSVSSDGESLVQGSSSSKPAKNFYPSLRHGGCINTAAWLTSGCGWRLSTRNGDESSDICAVETEELPSQLVTSGDDRLLKVWDVSEAMGSVSPLAGGTATFTPFSSYRANDKIYHCREKWQSIYDSRRNSSDNIVNEYRPPGTVRLLATVSTGHRGNVFHVTPLKGRRGTFATCGADGFLRLVDVERASSGERGARNRDNGGNSSTAVIHPMYDQNTESNPHLFDPENPLAYFLRNSSGMCFSHTMLDDSNVGLLCSEKGLIRFDFRLSPREQCTRSLLPQTIMSFGSRVRSLLACKACAVLRTDSGVVTDNITDGGSTYVFGA